MFAGAGRVHTQSQCCGPVAAPMGAAGAVLGDGEGCRGPLSVEEAVAAVSK